MVRILNMCNMYSNIWEYFIGEVIVKGEKEIGTITGIKKYQQDTKIIINDGDIVLITKWFETGKYKLKDIKNRQSIINFLTQEYATLNNEIKFNINLEKELIENYKNLNNCKRNSVDRFLSIVGKRKSLYHNHCWSCKSDISSEKDQFCFKCGWYKCSNCQACACNTGYMNNTTETYRKTITNNEEAKYLINLIEKCSKDIDETKCKLEDLEDNKWVIAEKILNVENFINTVKELA